MKAISFPLLSCLAGSSVAITDLFAILLLTLSYHNSTLYFPNNLDNFTSVSMLLFFLFVVFHKSHFKSFLERGRVRIYLKQRMTESLTNIS